MHSRLSNFLKIATLVGLVALVPLLAACSKTATTSTAGAPAAEVATVKLVAPTDGAEVPAGTVTVKVETTGLKFTMPSNTNVAGEGHVHFTLDDRPFEMSIEPEYEIKDVEPGKHTLKAELVQNNTQPLDPPVEQEITFTAK